MAGYSDETTHSSHPSSPDHGNGPGQSSSYFSGVGDALDSLTAAAETEWEQAKSETAYLWTGTKDEAAHLYSEANKWGTALVGAKSWAELHHIANVLLGPGSFYLGLACGVVENLGEMAWGLVDLVKTLILAGLYERLHGPLGVDAIEPTSMMLRFAAPVFDKILGKPMREADKKVRGMISGIGKIIKEPVKFLGTAWTSTKNDYVAKWNRYQQLFNSGRALDKFHAGELAGDALTQIVLTILAIISGVGAAVRGVQLVVGGVRLTTAVVIELTGNLSREAPELLEIAQGMKDADGAASTAKAAELVEMAPAAKQLTAVTITEHNNTVTWFLDSEGRTVRVEATIRKAVPGLKRDYQETRAQGYVGDSGLVDDAGGHIVGHRFIGDQGEMNMFPQNKNFNNSAYKKMENEFADWTKNGKEVTANWTFDPPGSARPESVTVDYAVTDPSSREVVYYNAEKFKNQAGQVFNRVPSADMPSYTLPQ